MAPRRFWSGSARLVAAVVLLAACGGPDAAAASWPAVRATPGDEAPGPGDGFGPVHLLDGRTADLTVQVHSPSRCSGTPISHGTLVVTAAHCVLDDDGDVARAGTVLRDGVTYRVAAVLVDPGYRLAPSPHRDAAVLVMERAIPGPSALLADRLPSNGTATLAGLQPVDAHGTLLREAGAGERHGRVTVAANSAAATSTPAGCVGPVAALELTGGAITVRCGLIPGASGGGLLVGHAGRMLLLGAISTVTSDLTSNDVVGAGAVRQLLARPDRYRHELSVPDPAIVTVR